MGTLPPTTYLGLVLPDPGTAQPYSRAVENGWLSTIDAAVGADRARLSSLESSAGALIPLSVFTVAASAGTITKNGSMVEYTTASNLELRGVFSADFLDYLLIMSNEAGPATGDGTFQLLEGTVPYTLPGYGSNRVVSPASGGVLNAYTAASSAVAFQTGAAHSMKLSLMNPQAAKTTFWHSDAYSTTGVLWRASGHVGTKQFDGIKILGAGYTGRIDVYGVAR